MDGRTMKRAVLAALALAGAGLTACADYPPPYGPPPPEPYRVHVRRCFRLHPNYDPRSNTWIDGNGYPHPCEA